MQREIPTLHSTWESEDGMSIYIEGISDVDDDGFFLVDIIDSASKNDPYACSEQLTSSEWFSMVDSYSFQLIVKPDSASK